jgi:two-component system, NarL family, response regulator DevR
LSERQQQLGVILIEPYDVVRTGLRLLLSEEPDLEVIGEAGLADEALAMMRHLQRRKDVVVVVGLSLEGEHDAFWLIRSIRDLFPTMVILASGANANGITVSRALFMGADGFVDKSVSTGDFVMAIRQAALGQVVLTGVPIHSFGDVVEGLHQQVTADPILTEREREVITVAARGLTAREMARHLGVRERTVTTHLAHIYKKLGCRTRVSALAAAQQSGLIPVASSR